MAAVLVPSAVPSAALAERWQRPVPGEVARSFSYDRSTPFAAGAHRGAVLAARPGTVVRAACGGQVIHAGPVTGPGRVVSVRCGKRRVSYLPLSTVAVRAGAQVLPGERLGTVAARDGGLHFGVRAEGDRFAYEDPLRLLTGDRRPLPIAGRPPASLHPEPTPRLPPVRHAPLGRPSATPAWPPARVAGPSGLRLRPVPSILAFGPRAAPWPVWAGLALVLTAVAGSGTIALRRHRQVQRSIRAEGSVA
jgi:hypothetical protein